MQNSAAHGLGQNTRYVIERELGHGGMGVVYQALDKERGARVALKALTQGDALNIYRLKNEFRQLADLSHPNLVTLHELVHEGDAWFFTMELVNGRTFDKYCQGDQPSSLPPDPSQSPTVATRFVRDASITISQRPIGSEFPLLPRLPANVRRLRHALRQLVEAVAALHDAGKLHRDLKPSNVLVTPEGRVVVLDFGLVSSSAYTDAIEAERTVGGCAFGTPAYMSPEQASGEPLTPQSDWYAVGSMLYEAITGQLPFDGTILEILRQKDEHEPIPPSELVRGVPDDLDQLCRELLRRDARKRPTGAEILRYLTGQSAPPPVFDAQSSMVLRQQGEIFVGREAHLLALRAAFEATKQGRPITALVHGHSGMGKTALVRCFANELIRGEEAVVLRGRCYERENVPYKAFDNIADALSRYLMGLPIEDAAALLPRNAHALPLLFPVMRRVKPIANARRPKLTTTDARELRNLAFGAFKELLLRISDFQPLVLNIDDLQWADMDSARLLAFLLGPPTPPPILLVGTYRRDEAAQSPFLQQVLGDRSLADGGGELRQIALDALTPEESSQLAGALLKDQRADDALTRSAVAAEAEGVPFFIAELVRHTKMRADRGEVAARIDPLSLDEVLLERVSNMPEDAQRLLHVLAVAAGPLEQGIAIDAAGLAHGDRAALLSLRAARLIRTRGTRERDTAETYHDRVRETVARFLPERTLKNLHARIADALARHDIVDPERLVVHYAGAGDGMRAGETAIEAARAAEQKLAFNRAAELYRKALELLPADDPQRRALHERLGDALANAGRGALAAAAYLESAEGHDEAEQCRLRGRAAQQYYRSGRIEEGTALTRQLFGQVGLAWPDSTARVLASWALSRGAVTLRGLSGPVRRAASPSSALLRRIDALGSVFRELSTLDSLRGAALQARYLAEALKAGEPTRLLEGLAWEAFNVALMGGSEARVRGVLARVDRLAEEVDSPHGRATALMARAGCEFFLARFESVLEPALQARELFRDHCPGTAWEQGLLMTFRLGAIEETGDLQEIAREAPSLARQAQEHDDRFARGFLALAMPAALMMADDPVSAAEVLRREYPIQASQFTTLQLWVVHRSVDLHLYGGDGKAALAHHLEHWETFAGSLLYRAPPIRVLGHWFLARAALGAASAPDAGPEALRIARRQTTALAGMGRSDARSWSLLAAAGVARIAGDAERAAQHLQDAIASFTRWQMPLFAIYAKRNLGLLRGGSEGARLVDDADAALRAQGVANPERWAATYAPGFS